jgi:hypothetical protein
MSDRAIARELGVSQPFVGSQRRLVAALPRIIERPPTADPTQERTTSARQALEQYHDRRGALGRVRPVSWPSHLDNPPALRDGDPFA